MARKGYKTATFTLPDGTRKYVYAKTQEELDQKVFDLKLQMKMGVDLKAQTTVGELIKMWYTTEVEPNIQNSTATNMKSVLNNHLMPMVSRSVAKDVTPLQVKLWINEINKLNKQAAKICFRALRQSFELAEENGLIYRTPVLSRYHPAGREFQKRTALTPEDETRLLDAVKPTSAYLLVWTALATGLRRGELLGLMWDCVDLDRATVTVRRNLVLTGRDGQQLNDYTKTEAGQRVVPIPPDLCAALRGARSKSKSVFVFPRANGTPFTAGTFSQFWSSAVHKRFGTNPTNSKRVHGVTGPRVTPHVLRHTYATRCFEAGMDIKEVQYLMGHASPQVTLEIYTHYCEESRRGETFEKARAARTCTTTVPHTPDYVPHNGTKNDGNVVHLKAL